MIVFERQAIISAVAAACVPIIFMLYAIIVYPGWPLVFTRGHTKMFLLYLVFLTVSLVTIWRSRSLFRGMSVWLGPVLFGLTPLVAAIIGFWVGVIIVEGGISSRGGLVEELLARSGFGVLVVGAHWAGFGCAICSLGVVLVNYRPVEKSKS